MESVHLNQLDGVMTKIESLLPTMSFRDVKKSSSLCGKAKNTLAKLYVSSHSFVRVRNASVTPTACFRLWTRHTCCYHTCLLQTHRIKKNGQEVKTREEEERDILQKIADMSEHPNEVVYN